MKRIVFVLILLALLLTGCGPRDLSIDDSAFLPGTTAMLDGLLAEDYDSCRAVMTSQVDDQTLRTAVEQMSQLLDGVESYTLTPVGWEKNVHNGIAQSAVRYEMQTEAGNYLVQVVLVEGVDGLAGFRITPIQKTTVTGTLRTMKGADVLQWLVLLFGIVEYGFVIWMAVDCLRRKPKGRVGWLLLILLISGIFTVTYSTGKVSFHMNTGIYLHLSGLLKDSTGGFMLKLYVPLGAIVYWFRQKKLQNPKVESEIPVVESNEEVSEEVLDN